MITSSRAEFGFLRHLARTLADSTDTTVTFIVSGLHIDDRAGRTISEIEITGVRYVQTQTVVPSRESPTYVASYLASAVSQFAEIFTREVPDVVILLGDRIETMAAALAAHSLQLPIAHLHGGERTLGLLDEGYRNAISKLASIHFPSTDAHRQAVIALGEAPSRVFNVGALAVEAVKSNSFISQVELEEMLNMELEQLLVVTFHPVTLAADRGLAELQALIKALEFLSDFQVLITGPNLDSAIEVFSPALLRFADQNPHRVRFVASLGSRQYLSILKRSVCCLGNSSSGLIEAPILGVPSIDIGQRQSGRYKPASVKSVPANPSAIVDAVRDVSAKCSLHNTRTIGTDVFGTGDTSLQISEILQQFHDKGELSKW